MTVFPIKTYGVVLVNPSFRNWDGEPEEVALFVQADSAREAIITAIVKAESISGQTGWRLLGVENNPYKV